jgi:hypothetical protein
MFQQYIEDVISLETLLLADAWDLSEEEFAQQITNLQRLDDWLETGFDIPADNPYSTLRF